MIAPATVDPELVPPDASALAAVLDRLAGDDPALARCREAVRDAARRATREVRAELPEEHLRRLAWASMLAHFAPFVVRRAVAELIVPDAIGARLPLAAPRAPCTDDVPVTWVVVTGVRGRHFEVEQIEGERRTSDRVDVAQLCALLGAPAADAPITWIAVARP